MLLSASLASRWQDPRAPIARAAECYRLPAFRCARLCGVWVRWKEEQHKKKLWFQGLLQARRHNDGLHSMRTCFFEYGTCEVVITLSLSI